MTCFSWVPSIGSLFGSCCRSKKQTESSADPKKHPSLGINHNLNGRGVGGRITPLAQLASLQKLGNGNGNADHISTAINGSPVEGSCAMATCSTPNGTMERDHRKLNAQQHYYVIEDEVGKGLPLWLPNGTVLRDELEKLAKEKEFQAGYQRVTTPHITKENLYLTSGHLPYYADDMFPPMDVDGENFYLKQQSLMRSLSNSTLPIW